MHRLHLMEEITAVTHHATAGQGTAQTFVENDERYGRENEHHAHLYAQGDALAQEHIAQHHGGDGFNGTHDGCGRGADGGYETTHSSF